MELSRLEPKGSSTTIRTEGRLSLPFVLPSAISSHQLPAQLPFPASTCSYLPPTLCPLLGTAFMQANLAPLRYCGQYPPSTLRSAPAPTAHSNSLSRSCDLMLHRSTHLVRRICHLTRAECALRFVLFAGNKKPACLVRPDTRSSKQVLRSMTEYPN